MSATFFRMPRSTAHTKGKRFRKTDTGFLAVNDENQLSASRRIELARECLIIPQAVARNYRGSEYDEALSAAQEGVWRAVCFWKEGQGADIKTYATQWALGYANAAVKRWRRKGITRCGEVLPRAVLPLTGPKLESHYEPDTYTHDRGIDDSDRSELVTARALLARLDERRPDLGFVVRQKAAGLTFREIGAALGVTRQAAEQQYARGVRLLKTWAGTDTDEN